MLLAAVCLFPGNPLWDLSRTRVPNTILVYVSLLPIGVASYRDRERWLTWCVGLSPWPRRVLITAVPLALAGLLQLFYWLAPLYVYTLSSEWGLIEPLTFWLYWVAAWSALSLARLRQAQGQEAKPYVLVAVLCGIAVLEECDYLGLFGGSIGRIHGMYVGAIHDLFTLWYRTGHDLRWPLAGIGGSLALASWLWHRGYLSGSFLRRELGSATSLPVLVGAGLLVLAQISDIDIRIFDRFAMAWCGVCEETLEFFFAVLLNVSLLLKYARDAAPKAWDLQPKAG
ncbi:hypothetical protein NKDENANG_01689 [Candidatus Entotheonellaceae bacterium PAL068K]